MIFFILVDRRALKKMGLFQCPQIKFAPKYYTKKCFMSFGFTRISYIRHLRPSVDYSYHENGLGLSLLSPSLHSAGLGVGQFSQ